MFNKLIEHRTVPKKRNKARKSMISIEKARKVQPTTQMHKFDNRCSQDECKLQSRPIRISKDKQKVSRKLFVSGDNNVPDTIRNTTLSVHSVDTKHLHKATPGGNQCPSSDLTSIKGGDRTSVVINMMRSPAITKARHHLRDSRPSTGVKPAHLPQNDYTQYSVTPQQ
jgi:hypothetical protein